METDEKMVGHQPAVIDTILPPSSTDVGDVDDAWKFLDKHRHENVDESIDIRAMTATYVATAVWEIPTVYLIQRSPVAKYMAANAILWGISTACGTAAHNYQTLLVTRIFLGIFEATINPSLILICGRWYTKPEQAPRLSFWLLGLGVGQIVGGAISYGFQMVPSNAVTTLEGWRIMFILLGLVTVVFGALTFRLMPDNPMEAPWLTDREKVALLKRISVNQTGVEDKKVKMSEMWEASRDPQVWLLWLSVILVSNNPLRHDRLGN
ncbi:hypothetical protein OQA88_8545 [Cercophora sp. LCS_1]